MNMGVSEGGLFAQGTLIANRYEVVSVLGTGAMGTVVRVIDRALDNEVCALKLLHPHHARDKTSFARFRNEVILARRLGHPNIARIYDIGLAGGGYYYISMEHIAGGSLNQVIYHQRREHYVFRDSLRMLAEIADGIAYAHKLGVVHRDLKPENILLGDRSEIKITDFGLARSLTADRGFTDTGETVGTPCYMAPEQLRGERVDGRCDIYALGILAYEIVVGRRPFFDESYFALAAMHMRVPIPDFATKDSGIPKWFEEFVKRCAAKSPGDRYQDAYVIVEELRERIRNFTTDDEIRRAPSVLSFYAPTSKHRSLPSRIRAAARWSLALPLVLSTICFGLWLNGVQLSGMLQILSSIVGGESAIVTAPEFFSLIERGEEEPVRALLRRQPKIAEMSFTGDTPLIASARAGKSEISRALAEAGANINAAGVQGMTALMHAAQRPGRGSAEVLLEFSADVNARDDAANTALIYAIRRGNATTARLLLERGATVNSRNEKGQTALFDAVLRKDLSLVQLLLSRSADPNVQDSVGRTPLSYAAAGDDELIVRALLQKGADGNLRDLSDRYPADYAGRKSRQALGKTGSAAIQSPQPTQAELTQLRSVGDPQFAFESTASGPRRIVRGSVKNSGSNTARQVSVFLQSADGKSIALSGPVEIEANRTADYSARLPDSQIEGPKDRLVIQCLNCGK